MPSAVAWHEVHSKAARQCSVLRPIAGYPQALLMACWRPSTAASHHKGQKGQLCAVASTGLQLLRQQAILPFCVRGATAIPCGGCTPVPCCRTWVGGNYCCVPFLFNQSSQSFLYTAAHLGPNAGLLGAPLGAAHHRRQQRPLRLRRGQRPPCLHDNQFSLVESMRNARQCPVGGSCMRT